MRLIFIVLMMLLSVVVPAQVLSYQSAIIDNSQGGSASGIDGTHALTASTDNLHVYATGNNSGTVALFHREVNGDLTFGTSYTDNAQGGTINGLAAPKRLTLSHDGQHLYVVTSTDNSLVVFSRNAATGALTYVETHFDGANGVDGLSGAFDVQLSPDDQHVYVVASVDGSISWYARNTSTGALTYLNTIFHTDAGISGLAGVHALKLSPDGQYVYTAGTDADGIAVFARNAGSGALTFVESQLNGINGVSGLNGIYDLALSPDDGHLYTVSAIDDAIAVFSRNSTTGTLGWLESHKDNSQGGTLSNLNGGRTVLVSPNGLYVMAVGSTDDGIEVLSRDGTTGLLASVQSVANGTNGAALDGARYIGASATGEHFYVAATVSDAITVWHGPGCGVDTTTVLDTVTVTVYDSVQVQVFDTTVVTVQDTTFSTITDTVPVFDTVVVTTNDTLLLTIYDTTAITITDTSIINITVHDTVTVTQTLYDTITVTHLDTNTITVYDTLVTTALVAVTDTLVIDISTGFPAPNDANTLLMYPNPATSTVTLNTGNFLFISTHWVRIKNVLGQEVFAAQLLQQEIIIPVNQFGAAGLYFVTIHDALGAPVAVKKLVLE